MNTAIPASLADALSRFLAGVSATRSINNDDSFDLVAFLAEAIFCAESNEFHGVPAVSAMLERLDECLDHQRTASEVRQDRATRLGRLDRPGRLLEWFDAP